MRFTKTNFPPYDLLDTVAAGEREADQKMRQLERLYHLTQKHSWDGRAVLGALVDRHGPPGADLEPRVKDALRRVMTVLMWGELAAWNISADLALEIPDVEAKMAATAQVFDEARHFYVLRDYVSQLGASERVGGLPTRLLTKVLNAPTLCMKLVGMQLLFETNAVVMFRRIGESQVCPILHELLPYFERDESRHVGLGVMYAPKLIERMSRAEARATARFQLECTLLLMGSGFLFREDFAVLGINQRQLAVRVSSMQDEVVRQMVEVSGRSVLRAVASPRAGVGPKILDFIHPEAGIDAAPAWHRRVHGAMMRAAQGLDRVYS